MHATGNMPEDYAQIRGGCSILWMIAVDYCFCTMLYSMQRTEQIPNGAKSTTTSNHPSTPTFSIIQVCIFNNVSIKCVTLMTIGGYPNDVKYNNI